MKALTEYFKQLINDDRLTLTDKLLFVSVYLCAFSIALSIVLAQLFALAIIIISIIQFMKNPKREKSPFDISLFIFILIRILSIFFSTDINVSIKGLYTEIPYYAIFYALAQQKNILNGKRIQSLLMALIIASIIAACYGAITVLLGLRQRAESFASGYYILGTFLTVTLTMTLILGKASIFSKKRWLWYGSVFMMAFGILLTLNRIHIVIMIIAFIVVGLIFERKLLAVIVVIILTAVLISPSINQRLGQTIHFTKFMSERDVLWMGALQISSNHPILGYGPYTFSEIFPFPDQLKDTKIGGWHNDYIQVYIESGSLGLLAMLWLMITIYRHTFVSIRNTKNDKQKIILALAAGISTIFLSSLTGSSFLNVLIRILFGFLLALLTLLIKQDGKENLNAAEGNF